MKIVTIDGREMTSRAAAHAHLAKRLSFPDHYGQNLDALHDCLTDICEDTHIVIYHYNDIESGLGLYAAALLHVLNNAAEESGFLTISCVDDAIAQAEEPIEDNTDEACRA